MGIQIVPGTGSRRAYDAKYKVGIGPWTGGLNTADNPVNLGENELQESINFLYKPDGSLRSRPPVARIDSGSAQGDLPFLTANYVVTHLGSVVVASTGNLVPIIAVLDTQSATGRTRFYRWVSGSWVESFHFVDSGFTFGTALEAFTSVVQYNNKYWFTSTFGTWEADNIGATPTLVAGLISTVSLIGFGDAAILKNRWVFNSGRYIFYSKTGDPSGWTSPNAGFIDTASSDSDTIRRTVVFQDSIWVMKNNGVYRLSWVTDPGVDGVYEKISNEGAYDAVTYNNDLYIINGKGVYKLVSTFFVEVSSKIRDSFRVASSNLDYTTTGAGHLGINELGLNKIGFFKLDSQLLCGPFNTMVPFRNLETTYENYISNAYFVLDLDTGLWGKWQFSAYSTFNPIAGPCQSPLPFSMSNPAAPVGYVWVGLSLPGAGTWAYDYANHMYTVNATSLSADTSDGVFTPGYDVGGNGASWIGGLFKTGRINLGDGTSWKRIFTSTLDAVFNAVTFAHGSSKLGFTTEVGTKPTIPAQRGRLKFGRATRCKEFDFYYDSITGVDILNTTTPLPELPVVKEFLATIQVSRQAADDS